MKNILIFCSVLLSLFIKGQITPSVTIPNPIPEFNGTYENFSQNHFFYPCWGEVRYNDEEQSTAVEEVAFYTQFTWPKKYILRNNNLSLVFSKGQHSAANPDSLHRIDIEMQNSSSGAFLARVDTQKTSILNYFTEWFGSTGRADVMGSAAIACQSIWPNIDMVYTSNNEGIKMYYIIYPGGDPNSIVLHVNGAKSSNISGNDLLINANWTTMSFEKPKMYQYVITGSSVTPITVCNANWFSMGGDLYKINNNTPYNSTLPLIVQISQAPASQPQVPGLDWSTYFGGNQYSFQYKTHTDPSNNLYVSGETAATNLPYVTGAFQSAANGIDGYISKFNSVGQLQWSTYIGGSGPEGIYDFDFLGADIYCVGYTGSNDLVCVSLGTFNDNTFGGGLTDGFILQIGFSSLGVMTKKWCTYFGGASDDEFRGCKFDNQGQFFVVGSSSSNLSPIGSGGMYTQTFNTSQLSQSSSLVSDGIILRFNSSTHNLDWFTFCGSDALGTNAHSLSSDVFYGIDISGTDLYVCGKSGGTNFPSVINGKYVPNNYDGILVYFSTGGAIISSKYTDGNLFNYSVDVYNGNVYAVGQANQAMNAYNSTLCYYNGSCSNGDTHASFSIHSSNLSSTIHHTFIGGSYDDAAYDIKVGTNGVAYISGGTNSNDFPTVNVTNMYNSSVVGNGDNFIVALRYGITSMIWSTYIGGNDLEPFFVPNGGNSLALNNQNDLFLEGNSASPSTFPLDNGNGTPYFQSLNGSGGGTGTITRFDMTALNFLVSINENVVSQELTIYPNPTKNYINFNNSSWRQQILKYVIFDVNGKIVDEKTVERLTGRIDVSTLINGMYFVKIFDSEKYYGTKFIKLD